MLTLGIGLVLLLLGFPSLAQAHALQFVDYAGGALLLLTGVALAMLLVLDRRARRASQLAATWYAQTTHAGRLALVGQLMASIIHELTQPLSAIFANVEAAQLLLQRPSPDLTLVRTILADINDDDLRAREVVQRLRTMLRTRELQLERVDFNALVRDALALIVPDARRRGVVVATSLAADLPPIPVDPVHLRQVLLNLVMNALEAMQNTPAAARRVEVRTERRDRSFMQVTVTDTGHGIAAEHAGRVFDPFFTTKSGGMGLGLQIAHSIVEMHGGTIWAENRAGGGAAFKFLLPLQVSPGTTQAAPPTNAAGRSADATSLRSAVRGSATKQHHGFSHPSERRDDSGTSSCSGTTAGSAAHARGNARDPRSSSRRAGGNPT